MFVSGLRLVPVHLRVLQSAAVTPLMDAKSYSAKLLSRIQETVSHLFF